ncbi:hypothetical protein DFQ12_2841 [Sphingobacterium detergens]|uniref:Uncharacterized protein n=1 Tax=Sphingobacterium detergens TaxID=1145106 RepID=A0A420B730_SPHD1|nr:hypothetical protein DFQ12_2841 [Sphingobacterium detergens]
MEKLGSAQKILPIIDSLRYPWMRSFGSELTQFYHQVVIYSVIVKEKFFTYFHSGPINIKNVLQKNSFPKDIPSYILLLQNELATRIFCQHSDIKSDLNDHLSYRNFIT